MSNPNTLFVSEEEDLSSRIFNAVDDEIKMEANESHIISYTHGDDDDPVVEEIPLNMVGENRNLHVFQYINRPKLIGRKPSRHPEIAGVRYQRNSSVWELDLPLNDSTFFNKDKIERDWQGTNIQTIKGVAVENKGQFAGFVSDGQVYLVPVNKVTQLRPYFKYIDEANQQKKQEDAKQNVHPASQRAHVITMSVKSVNDQSQNRLTGSLMAHKIADEEKLTELNWQPENFEEFKDSVVTESSQHTLESSTTVQEYLTNLV